MFKLRKIEITGFKDEKENIVYDFSESNTTVIYGQNGCGKTSMLQIIYAVFAQDEPILITNNVKKVCVWCQKDGNELYFEVNEVENSDNSAVSSQYNWTKLEELGLDKIAVLFLGVDRSHSFSAVSASPAMIFDFMRTNSIGRRITANLGTSVVRRFAEVLSSQINYNNRARFVRVGDDRAIFSREHLYLVGNEANIENVGELIIERYRDIKLLVDTKIQNALMNTLSQSIEMKAFSEDDLLFVEAQLKENFLLLSEVMKVVKIENNDMLSFLKTTNMKEIIERCKANNSIGLLLKNIISNILPNKNFLLSIFRLQKMFNERLSYNKKIEITDNEIKIRLNDKGDYHDINKLSSGEKQFLTLLTCVFIDSKKRELVLIDEPEISLNIKWQSELIDILMDNAPETQFLLATHSPGIVDDHIECLKELEREV